MDTTSSVSKGIFVFKKKRKSPQKSGSKRQKLEEWKNEAWYEEFHQTWRSLELQMQELYKEMFSKLLTSVTSYLTREINETQDIPTATILTGINIPDHAQLFQALEKQLRDEMSPHVVVLSSRSCTKVRSLLGNVLQQCQNKSNNCSMQDGNSDEEEDLVPHRKMQCTFDKVAQWYENQYENTQQRPPLIIILTDFESFVPQVLEDFIYIASEYKAKVPLVLVFGVATTESAVHSSLPHRVMSRLRMEVFVSQNSNSLLHQLISKVILSPNCRFKVGGKVFGMLTDNFLFYDFSVQSFLQKLKLCMLEHFSGSLAHIVTNVVKKKWSYLNAAAIESIHKLSSSMKFVQSCEPRERSMLLLQSDYFKEVVADHVDKFDQHFTLFLVGLQCLHEITCCLPGSPMGKHLGDLYFRAVSRKVWDTDEFAECRKLWKHMAKLQLESHLKNMIHILNSGGKDNVQLRDWSTRLRSARKKLQALDRDTEEGPSTRKTEHLLDPNTNALKDRAQLHKHLKENARTAPVLNKFEMLREDILGMLEEMFSTEKENSHCLLYPPGLMPYNELVMFDNLASVKHQLIGNSRAALTIALSNPAIYLKCECCVLDSSDDVLPTMPDVCIAYKVHLESGKHINLYDWLQAFHCIVNEASAEEVDAETQARFTQAVAELQFLGFVKPTSRKADHVMRLTWGTM